MREFNATSIAEEGLDIPAVDHVIFYEPIPSEIRYIQRRGRTGRKAPGKVTILATNESLDMIYLYASRKRTERMKTIAQNVNQKLQTIIRTRLRPTPNPLTQMELKVLEEEARPVKVEPEIVKSEIETLKEFKRKVARSTRILYMKLLERGTSGATLDQIVSDMEFEAASTPVVKASLGLLMKEGIVEAHSERYAAASAVKSVGKKTYEVKIEKIYPGLAVVRVNDKYRARLEHDEYNGPRDMIKKNARFTAIANLYRKNGTLCIKIKEVTQTLN